MEGNRGKDTAEFDRDMMIRKKRVRSEGTDEANTGKEAPRHTERTGH